MRILIAGFGPFPGAARNPSADLARELGRMRRPSLTDVTIHAVVLPTIYAAVERELSRRIAKIAPDAIILFGLAGRADRLRVETRAVNAASRIHPDATRLVPKAGTIRNGAPHELFVNAPVRRLLAAARSAGVPARLSRDAGRYVCNASLFLCLDTVRRRKRPPLVTFIHIPPPRPRRPHSGKHDQPSMAALVRAGAAIVNAVVAETRR
jgi:pyroglutamyl-peptidase